MAPSVSSSTKSTPRRAARRTRRRARRSEPNVLPAKTPRRRGPKRRKLREQDSLDLDSCYYACEDRGYHLDPDVRVGLETNSDANPYWVSEGEATDPTVAFEEPCPSSECSAVGTSAISSPAVFPEAGPAKVVFKRKDTQCPPQMDILTRSASPSPLSTPAAASTIPRVQFFPDYRSEFVLNGRPPEYRSNYLSDIRIPSPLLYHNAQFDYVRPSADPRLTWSSSFSEYIYGQQKPEPDFTSWRPVEHGETQDERTNLKRHESLGFAICTASSSRHKAEASHISDDSHDSSTHCYAPSPRNDSLDSQELSERSQGYSCTVDVSNNPTITHIGREIPWYSHSFVRTSAYDTEINLPLNGESTCDDLIFPTLPTPFCLQHSLPGYYSPNNTIQPEGNQAANSWGLGGEGLSSCPRLIDNTPLPSTLDTVEAAIRAVRRGREAQSTQLSPERNDDKVVPDEAQPGAVAKVVIPPRTDLVPAHLYQHQFIAWPPSTPAVNAKKGRDRDISGLLNMVDWLENLNTLGPYNGGQLSAPALAPRPEETKCDFREDALASAPLLSPTSSVHVQCYGSQPDDESGSGRHEEGYFTHSERDSEVDLLDDPVSDDEWASCDWDFEPDDMSERIGLFATGWEAASNEHMA